MIWQGRLKRRAGLLLERLADFTHGRYPRWRLGQWVSENHGIGLACEWFKVNNVLLVYAKLALQDELGSG